MQRLWVLILIVFLILAIATWLVIASSSQRTPIFPISPSPTTVINPTLSPTPPQPPPSVSQVKIYLIAVGDEGKAGPGIGCGDSVVSITRNIESTSTPLTTAYQNLLSLKEREFGQSGLINTLYQSNLKLDRAVIQDSTATINLSGNLQLGGVCDTPRVEAQLTQTALQFPSVKKVNIFLNNIPLEQALSQR